MCGGRTILSVKPRNHANAGLRGVRSGGRTGLSVLRYSLQSVFMRRSAFLILLLATTVRADDAASLLARWVTAAGGAERISSVDVIHPVGESSDDGTHGTRDEWVTRALARRELVDHGHDRWLTGVVVKGSGPRHWNR